MDNLKERLKTWWNNQKIVIWCKNNPGSVVTIFGGICTVLGGVLNIINNRTEYRDHVFITTTDNEVVKIPARKMRTANQNRPIRENL